MRIRRSIILTLLVLAGAWRVRAQSSFPPTIYQNQGTSLGTAVTFNCSTGLNCTLTSGTLTITASGGTGTVTSIATTAPLGGGTITTTGTLTCTTCVVATAPGVGLAHFAGSTQTVTSSAVTSADATGNTSGSGNFCLVTSCVMVTPNLGTPSALVLTNATGLPLSALANLGTTVTVLHGNAAGNPSFAVVTPSDAAGNISGSGNFCLVTSCVMVTPALGTPASGVMSNTTTATQAALTNNTTLASTAYADAAVAARVQVIQLTSQYTNSTNSFTNVTGGNTLAFTAAANTKYVGTCHLYYQAATTAGGLQIQFTGPASPTGLMISIIDPKSATTFVTGTSTTYSNSLGGAVTTATTNFEALVSIALQNGANAGTVNLQAADIANAVQLQIQIGSYCEFITN